MIIQPKPGTKQALLAAMLVRDEGASLDIIVEATGWQPHSARAAITGLKKLGYKVDSDKMDGVRTYRATEPR